MKNIKVTDETWNHFLVMRKMAGFLSFDGFLLHLLALKYDNRSEDFHAEAKLVLKKMAHEQLAEESSLMDSVDCAFD